MLARPRVKLARAPELRANRRRVAVGGADREGAAGSGGGDDDSLFEELRSLRRRIADREGVPAYVIFHDATLRQMAAERPATPEELLLVSGVGERKLEKYGEEFLTVLTNDQHRR
jgi:ATP-dependent DNA helicase RecQ